MRRIMPISIVASIVGWISSIWIPMISIAWPVGIPAILRMPVRRISLVPMPVPFIIGIMRHPCINLQISFNSLILESLFDL